MKNQIFFSLALLIGIAMVSCNNAPAGEKAKTETAKAVKEVEANKTFQVTENSLVNWTGSKLGGQHIGTLNISDGQIEVAGDKVVGGKFTIDINSLTDLDMKPGEGKEKLEGHLKSADFFDVANNPTSTFEITEVKSAEEGAPSVVTGNLTLMGVTKSITFPANIQVLPQGIAVETPKFTINRTDFGMKYGSASFFDNLKDKAINDQVGLSILVRAR